MAQAPLGRCGFPGHASGSGCTEVHCKAWLSTLRTLAMRLDSSLRTYAIATCAPQSVLPHSTQPLISCCGRPLHQVEAALKRTAKPSTLGTLAMRLDNSLRGAWALTILLMDLARATHNLPPVRHWVHWESAEAVWQLWWVGHLHVSCAVDLDCPLIP